MSAPVAAAGVTDNALQSAHGGKGPATLADIRRAGREAFASLPMPGRDDERWRFSDVRSLSLDGFAPAGAPSTADASRLVRGSALTADAEATLVFVDGHCVSHPALSAVLVKAGVVFAPIEDVVRERPELLRDEALRHPALLGGAKMLALQRAWFGSGYVLHVPDDVELTKPLSVVHWALAEGSASFPHALIRVGARARAAVHEWRLGAQPDLRTLSVSATDLHAGPGAKIERLSVQNWGSAAQSFEIDTVTAEAAAEVTSVNAAVGARRARLENVVRLQGEGADVRLLGITVATGEQEFDQRTLQVHAAPGARSDLLFKNALLDRARTVFSGLIKVEPGAQRTDAYQTNRNLLLSPEAEADSLPGLEIEANDVKCSHGATTGQISPEELFYLLARGIPLAAAQELLAQGFLEEVLTRIGDAGAADAVRGMLRAKFHS
ncbi:MAG: Fe-S cluster assembly protein SufD [Verrucomicrobia bacterium]|nr:Fe-S cluster assembly protein SufD [Verrucomicrobiota bacterium]